MEAHGRKRVAEFVNGLSFMKSGKTAIIIGTVNADVTVDVLAELLADFREEFLASFVAHGSVGEVSVHAGSIQSLTGFG